MEQDLDYFEDQIVQKTAEIQYKQEQIKFSSTGNSPQVQQPNNNLSFSNNFDMFDQIMQSKIEPKSNLPPSTSVNLQTKKQPNNLNDKQGQNFPDKNKPNVSIIQQVEKQWIIKQAELQRIGGTHDFFTFHLQKYKKHLQARKIVLLNMSSTIDKFKVIKAHPIMILKEYFKEYSSLCANFHEKSYKYQISQRQQSDNKMVNMRIQLKIGFQKLFNLRKQAGNQMNRLQKFMKSTIIPKLQKSIEVYWGVMAANQAKSVSKREHFEEKQKKIQKRIQKIEKVYGKGRIGNQIQQDVFEQMSKFVKEQRQLRYSIYDWGRQLLILRKNIISADYGFFTELEGIISQFKNFNDTVYQLQKKKYNFVDRLKRNIETNYLFEKLCTPLDSDYIASVLNLKKKAVASILKQQDYEQFLNQEYFSEIIGQTTQFLKGTIVKLFPLKNPDQELAKTVSGNLVFYNKKNLEIKYKMKAINTKAQFLGNGCVELKQLIKGIIFDSQNTQKVYFKDNNRAEQIVIFLSGQFSSDLP